MEKESYFKFRLILTTATSKMLAKCWSPVVELARRAVQTLSLFHTGKQKVVMR
jgi:hypothetical protein